MVRIAAYCRVSTDKNDQLNSLENQISFFQEYAASNNCRLVQIYADKGLSGTTLKNRKELINLLRDAHEDRFDLVVIKDISRLARNAIDFLTSIRQLKSLGISCKFVTSNLSTEDGELILGIMALVAQEESANLSKRVKFGKLINAQKGRVPNSILGYNRIDNYHLSINENEADIIRMIFNLYTVEKSGIRKICSALTEKGISTRFGSIWYPSTVRRILSNSIYCGLYENNKWEISDFIDKKMVRRPDKEHFLHIRPEWTIITQDTFVLAQKLLAQHNSHQKKSAEKHGKRYSNEHIFSNLIQCEICGSAFTRKKYKNKSTERIYWKCRKHDQQSTAACTNASTLDESELVDAIRSFLSENLNWREIKDLSSNKFLHAFNKQNFDVDIQKYKTDLKRLERTIAKYRTLYLEDMLSIEELRQKTNNPIAQMNTIIKQIQLLESNHSRIRYESLIDKTVSDVFELKNITNNEMRTLIAYIEVDENGEAVIFFTGH